MMNNKLKVFVLFKKLYLQFILIKNLFFKPSIDLSFGYPVIHIRTARENTQSVNKLLLLFFEFSFYGSGPEIFFFFKKRK
jgi:hypothetical protein